MQQIKEQLVLKVNKNAPKEVQDEIIRLNKIVETGTIEDIDQLIYTYKCAIKMLQNNGRSLMAQALGEIVTQSEVEKRITYAKQICENLIFLRQRRISAGKVK
mgnify:CR=1 FL=1